MVCWCFWLVFGGFGGVYDSFAGSFLEMCLGLNFIVLGCLGFASFEAFHISSWLP